MVLTARVLQEADGQQMVLASYFNDVMRLFIRADKLNSMAFMSV